MDIEQCEVRIETEEDFNKVSKICLDNGGTWIDDDDKFDSIDSDYKSIEIDGIDGIDDNGNMCYTSNDDKYDENSITTNEFIKKYGNKEMTIKSREIENCTVKVTTPEEFKRVEDLCFANGIYWSSDDRGIHYSKFFNEPGTMMTISDTYGKKDISYNNCLSDYSGSDYSGGKKYISFGEFIKRYDKSTQLSTQKINNSLYKIIKIKVNQNNTSNIK